MMAMLAPMSTITDTATLMPAVVRWLLMIIVAIMTRKVMRMRLVPEGDWHAVNMISDFPRSYTLAACGPGRKLGSRTADISLAVQAARS